MVHDVGKRTALAESGNTIANNRQNRLSKTTLSDDRADSESPRSTPRPSGDFDTSGIHDPSVSISSAMNALKHVNLNGEEESAESADSSPLNSPQAPTAARSSSFPASTLSPASPLRSSKSRQSIGSAGVHSHLTPASARQSLAPVEQPVPRLVIKKLVLTNFKSYAGTQEIGPFHTSFSAVVGPNGSGKSNVIDSLLFVFGFRASKMRQEKISFLIHNSALYPNLTSCQVDVHFCEVIDNVHPGNGEPGVTEMEGSSLIVSRRAYKNNSSKYYINGRDSPYSEVATLLKGKGIDLDHKRFLILQGEVESIAQMKPKADGESDDGLLEYLEDIIGTSHYKQVLSETATKLESLNEDCAEKSNRLQVAEKDLKLLDERREEILGFLRSENQIATKKHTLCQLVRYNVDNSIKITSKTLEDHQESLQELSNRTSDEQEELKVLETTFKENTQRLSKLKAQHTALTKQFSKLEIQKVQQDERQRHHDTKKQKLEKALASAKREAADSENWLSQYTQEEKDQSASLEESKASLVNYTQELTAVQEELKHKTQPYRLEIDRLQEELVPWRQRVSDKEGELAVANSQLELLHEQMRDAAQKIEDAKARVEAIVHQGKAKEQEKQELLTQIAHMSSQIILGEKEFALAQAQIGKLRAALMSARSRVESAKESARAFESQGAVLKSLLKLSNGGRVSGVSGRLGSLGNIDQKYDVAISTACPSLDNIVVDTVRTGEQCVDYLRKNNIGRAKFILLEKLPHRDLSPINTPENAPRLFDLVQPHDPKYAPAFYSVLNDTLVAKDIEQARRIAYGSSKRWRVVTLDGALVDKAGTLSGGGQPLSGGMRGSQPAVDQATIQSYEEELAALEKQYSAALEKFNFMESKLNEFKEKKPQLESDVAKVNFDIDSCYTSLREAQKLNRESKANRTGPDESEVSGAELRIKEKESELEQVRKEMSTLEQKVKDLDEQIMNVGGLRLREIKAKVDDCQSSIEIQMQKLTASTRQRVKTENKLKNSLRSLQQHEKDLEHLINEFALYKKQTAQVDDEVNRVQDEIDRTTDDMNQMEEVLAETKPELEQQQKDLDKVRAQDLELRSSIDQLKKSMEEDRRRSEAVREEMASYSLHPIARYEGEEEAEDEFFAEHSPDELSILNEDKLREEISKLEHNKNDDVHVDLHVLEDYHRRRQDYEQRKGILNEAVEARDNVKKQESELKQRRLDEFMVGFHSISSKLKEMYQMITMGGNAELELVDSLDPFSEGILFSVMPPKKSWRNISNLSGGEKTLSSLALVFALHHYKPTPLYVMDEIDAALDFRNVSIVATYIKERTKHGQFIVISLRNNMFELARMLVGIYKVNNMTKSVTLQNKDYIHRGQHQGSQQRNSRPLSQQLNQRGSHVSPQQGQLTQ